MNPTILNFEDLEQPKHALLYLPSNNGSILFIVNSFVEQLGNIFKK